ncbi:MAG: FMN reductase (NADH) RutF [Methanomassiliicoccales archaeon PtaU1.Bin124]|nr:MAG: FMN reductase (NADH) RutF [Methanomassiliicoccales archaeon PtaU1.Bin124]
MKRSLGPSPLLFPSPAIVICSYDKEGRANAMTAAWSGISCSDPPCVSISLRKETYTYWNIMETKAFTVNIPSEEMVRSVDSFAMTSGRKADKLRNAGMTPIRSEVVNAPFIDEFPMALECQAVQFIELGMHTMFVGEIKDVKVSEETIGRSGEGLMMDIRPLVYSHDDHSYYSVGKKVANVGVSIGR